MSGGTFDYIQYRIDDAIRYIKTRIKNNHKTIIEHWNETPEEDRKYLNEKPWDVLNCPFWVLDESTDAANKELGLKETYNLSDISPEFREKWNNIKREVTKKICNEHNNSYLEANYSDETIAKIKEMLETIEKSKIYLQRLDLLFAGDDGEDNFLKRTEEDLKKLKEDNN